MGKIASHADPACNLLCRALVRAFLCGHAKEQSDATQPRRICCCLHVPICRSVLGVRNIPLHLLFDTGLTSCPAACSLEAGQPTAGGVHCRRHPAYPAALAAAEFNTAHCSRHHKAPHVAHPQPHPGPHSAVPQPAGAPLLPERHLRCHDGSVRSRSSAVGKSITTFPHPLAL